MKYKLGIDPGVSGGIAYVSSDLKVKLALKMPTRKDGGVKPKNEVDADALATAIYGLGGECYLEKVSAMSGQGVTSMFNFGKAYGVAIGVLEALEFDVINVSPRTWKKELGLSSDKELSMALAFKLFPEYPEVWRHDGVSEAALLAYYGHVLDGNVKLEKLK